MSYLPPLKITIPLPSPFAKTKGIYSTGHRGGNLRVRCTNAEYDIIKYEAEQLGITLANFTRWCAIKAASALLEHRSNNIDSIECGEDNNETTDT
jgi:hypothetical protein